MNAIDTALRKREAEGKPIRVGMIGAGSTGRAIALQLGTPALGIRLVALANRTRANGERALREAGFESWVDCSNASKAASEIQLGRTILTDDPHVLTSCENIDIIVEVTGSVGPAARVVLDAIDHRKHTVIVNAELDSLLGPLLKAKADEAGVVFTNTDGDEPGVAMTLLRYLRTLGLRPVAAGNIKGMVDYYRNPDTQSEFARRHGQDARKVTSFADATKLSMEATVLANATGFKVGQRGMYGTKCDHVSEMATTLPADEMLSHGLIDYALGAAPHTGAFVVVHEDSNLKRAQFSYNKLGDGPFYVFHTPFHVPHVQVISTIARAVLFGDATVSPIGRPVCEVVSMAKKDMCAGEILDGVGGFSAYGLVENSKAARVENALPISLSEGCVLCRNLKKGEPISLDHVEIPRLRLADKLFKEQLGRWPTDLSPGGANDN